MLQKGWIGKHSVSARDVNRIKPFLQELSSSNMLRFSDSMHQLIDFYFDTPQSHGVLSRFGNDFDKFDPIEWAA